MTIKKFASIADPAIRWHSEDRPGDGGTSWGYWVSRDESELVAAPGEQIKLYSTRRLTRSQWERLDFASGEAAKKTLAFRMSVVRVDGPQGTWTPRGVDERDYRGMTDEELDRFELYEIDEIGQLVIEYALLPFGSPGGYSQPGISRLVQAARSRAQALSAARSQVGAAPTQPAPAAPSTGL